METTIQLLDRIKTQLSISSDYKLAQALEISKNAVTNYRSGRSHPNDDVALKIAALLDEDAGRIAACLHAERAQSDQARELWEKVAMRLQGSCAALSQIAVCAIVVVALSPLDSRASSELTIIQTPRQHIMLSNSDSSPLT